MHSAGLGVGGKGVQGELSEFLDFYGFSKPHPFIRLISCHFSFIREPAASPSPNGLETGKPETHAW